MSTRKNRSPASGRESRRRQSRHRRAPVEQTVRAGADLYDRDRHLPWLAQATPGELSATDPETTRAIVDRLTHALRAERRRGRANHWTYDINRHIALLQAIAAEQNRLGRMTRSRRPDT